MPALIALLALVLAYVTFNQTPFGRYVTGIGANAEAVRRAGVNTRFVTLCVYVLSGTAAAMAGIILAARLGSGSSNAGQGFELDVIAAVFIGGASASGGVGKVMGAVIGAFIMGVMNNGMSIMGVGIDWQQVVKGLVLLAAVIFDVYNKNKA